MVHILGNSFTIDKIGNSFTYCLSLGLIGIVTAFAIGLNLEVEDDKSFLTARSDHDFHVLILFKILNVCRSKGALCHINITTSDSHLQVGYVGEVFYLNIFGLSFSEQAFVSVETLVGGVFIEFECDKFIWSSEGTALDDVLCGSHFIGVENLFVDDWASISAQYLTNKHIVLDSEMEHDSGWIRRINGINVRKQRRRTSWACNLIDTVEREFHIRSSQIVPVGELKSLLQLDGEFTAISVERSFISGNIRFDLATAIRR